MTQGSVDNRAVLARLIREKKQGYNAPLSHGQQALWFIYQNAPDSHAYTMAWPVVVEGELKMDALQRALASLVARHSALRSSIGMDNGQPIQAVKSEGDYHFQHHDGLEWSELELNSAMKEAYEQPFDLASDVVLRANLFQVGSARCVLLLTMHHIFGDATSMNILGNELMALYQGEVSGEKPALPDIASYVEFVHSQTEMLNSADGEELSKYWKSQLGVDSPILNLTTDYPRPAIQSYNGGSIPFRFSSELDQQLTQLAQQEKTTTFTLLLTAFQILLHRYTGQEEIWIGTPTSTSRRQPEFANLIGYLANPVVLRGTFDPAVAISFRELLSQNKPTVLEAVEHSAYPFSSLVKDLQPERDLSYTPLFQILLDFQPEDALSCNETLTDLTVSDFDFPQMEGQFDLDLTLNMSEHGESTGRLKFNRDLFKAETVERMVGHFQTILQSIVANPDQPVHSLSLLADQEIQQLQTWNDSAVDYPKDLTLVNLFEQQVEQTPDEVALVFDGQRLSYRELNQRANQLAHYLLGLKKEDGSGPLVTNNCLIAISVERSLEMVIGLYAIIKAGGAYVPIDPSYPANRIQHMLDDSAAPVLLTQGHLKGALPLDELNHDCAIVSLDEADFSDMSGENPPAISGATDLAYVIYTSGSTGKPKGAMNAHSGIVNRLLWMQDAYQIASGDRILQKTPFSFDVSVWEFFWPLITGATLFVAKPEGHKDPVYLATEIETHGITTLHFVPSMLQTFVNYADMKQCGSLKRVICSGEALGADLVGQFFTAFAGQKIELHNLYGPTEAAVDVTYWPCHGDVSEVLIGKPVANTRLHILDANHQVMPIGIPGELCIAGEQVGRGYLNRPELTAEKFTEVELFGQTERIYKTGDLARWRADGNLEYLGRLDHQVKLRGFRIELGEIESTLLQAPAVKETVVMVREAGSDQKQLVAYVVAQMADDKEDADLTLELKAFLQDKLPDYMVPAFFVYLEALPLSPNGKLDRKALPEPLSRNDHYVYPRDSIELRLAQVWEKLFNVSPIGVLENFFEIGGDSLLAIRLVFNIKEEFGVTIPLNTLFQYGTVEQLACVLRDGDDTAPPSGSPIICLQSQGTKSPLFFVHASGGSAFDYMEIATLMGTDRPFYAIHPRGIEPGETFPNSVEEMAADYTAAIREIQPQGPYLLAGWSFGGAVIFEIARILEDEGETVPFLLTIDTPEPSVNLYKEDDVEFLLDRLPYWEGLTLDALDSQNTQEAQLSYLLKELKLTGLFTPDIDQAYAQNWLNLYKHHNRLIGPYKPSGLYNGKIIFYKPAEKTPFDAQMGKPIPAWEKVARGGIEVYDAPGNHFNMVSPTNTPVLIQMMRDCIEREGFDDLVG